MDNTLWPDTGKFEQQISRVRAFAHAPTARRQARKCVRTVPALAVLKAICTNRFGLNESKRKWKMCKKHHTVQHCSCAWAWDQDRGLTQAAARGPGTWPGVWQGCKTLRKRHHSICKSTARPQKGNERNRRQHEWHLTEHRSPKITRVVLTLEPKWHNAWSWGRE